MTDAPHDPGSPPAPAEPLPGATAAETPVDTGATTTPSAVDAGADTPTEGDEGEKPNKRRGGGFQDRIKELTDKVKERDLRIAELAAPRASGEAAADAPKRENFASYEDFVEAKATFAAEQTFERKERERAQQRSTEARDERLTAFQSEMTADAAADPAFAKAWQTVTAKGFPISDPMGEFIAESDDPASIIEYLASNPAEAAKLYNAPASQVARTLARIEAKTATAPPARTPQAPPPPPTVGGRSTPRVDLAKLASASNPDDYIAARRKQMGA